VGTGPHLCFLHGFCEDSSIWDGLIESLAHDYTCIAIDLPGFGNSSKLQFTSIPEVAHQVNELLINEKAENCILFGHSMGGYIAAAYLEKYADSLVGVAFVHSTVVNDPPAKKENRQKTIDFINQHGTQEFFRLFVPGLVAIQNRSKLREQLTNLVSSTPNKSIVNGLQAMMKRPSSLESVAQFSKPILFIKGQEDTHYKELEIYRQASLCSLVQLSVLQNVGHLSMLDLYVPKPKFYLTKSFP